jgi:hypothetical protein
MDTNQGFAECFATCFGLTYTYLSEYLRFGVRLFVETFRGNPLAQVSIPLAEEIKSFKEGLPALSPSLIA